MTVHVKQVVKLIRLRVILLSMVSLASLGCFNATREAVKVENPARQQHPPASVQTKTASEALHRDETPPDTPDKAAAIKTIKASFLKNGVSGRAGEKKEPSPMRKSLVSGESKNSSVHVGTSGSARLKHEKVRSEEDYVRNAAVKLANEYSAIKKIKICYDSKDEEWWIVLYQNAGAFYDLKQYVWNIYLDDPLPFLVVERVSKRRLEDHLYAKESNRRCTVLAPPKAGWLAVLRGSEVWEAGRVSAAQSRDRRTDRTVRASARPLDRSARLPGASGPRARHVKVAKTTSDLRENRAKEHRQSATRVASKNSHQMRGASTEGTEGTLRESFPQRVRAKHQVRENNFVSTEIGVLRSHSISPERTLSRVARRSGNPSLSQVPDKRTANSSPTVRKVAQAGQVRPAPGTRPNVSSHSDGLKPEYRTASAGARERSGTSFETRERRYKDRSEPSQRLTSMRIRSDQSGESAAATLSSGAKPRTGVPTYFVFAYGSKMNHPELLEWMESHGYDSSMIIDATPGILEGYDYVWNFYSPTRGGGAVNLERKKNAKVWGLLIEFQDPLLRAFDEREANTVAYSRGQKRVAVKRVQDGKTVFAWLYLAKEHSNGRRDIWPTREYKQTIIQAARFWGFPEDYVSRLKSWKTR